jgi:adenylate cyclase
MAELIAQGRNPEDRWRRPLPVNVAVVVGRDAPPWSVPWDTYVSRRHAALTWRGAELEVEHLPSGRNPIYHLGEKATRFSVKPGGRFVIGETTFTIADEPAPKPGQANQVLRERTFTSTDLKRRKVANAAHHLDVLSRLPEVISGAANDRELYASLVNLLLAGIVRAEAAALVSVEEDKAGSDAADAGELVSIEQAEGPPISVLFWDRRQSAAGEFQPSNRLILEAIRRRDTVMHIWTGMDTGSYTQDLSFDWAFCTPVRGETGHRWAIYITGRFASELATSVMDEKEPTVLLDDLKFADLVAALWSALHQVDVLKHRQASLRQFFSPAVLRTLSGADPDVVLKPKKADVTVLFCDLRGFSREAEKRELLAMLEGVSKALGFMTQNILDQGGVIGDYHGDAAMGFWGWPMPQPDMAHRAILAALGIRALFEAVAQRPEHSMADFRVGIGIASGPAVAGKIGTVDQVKVTVFGPVVNLAARLEGMTKILRAPILLDEPTAQMVRAQVPTTVARLRRLARVRPFGMETPLIVSELLPPAPEFALLNDAHLADYDSALDDFLAGRWPEAYELLHHLPPHDRGKDFLTAFILQHNHAPPPGWDGVIPMGSK